ncbi:MAG: S-methyl-5-thioribose-1-phosphate isomerase [Planctomycetes bacterium]|nr:S-methyl-5-thioribose-1-phosphate isomerase [Planctomycetota bacterium]
METIDAYQAVTFDHNTDEIVLLDQTLLPNETRFLRLREPEAVWEAIRVLRVRGAPAIGIAAAYGFLLAAIGKQSLPPDEFRRDLSAAKTYLASARPTAVNLFWALDRMEKRLNATAGQTNADAVAALRAEADAIRDEDIAMCQAIGDNGLTLLAPGMGLLTHCNAGQLAASRYGTALAPISRGQEQGYNFRVFADETRPLLQGARLTAFELHAAGVDVTLICDNMAATVMGNGWINAVLVGCDRVAANGDAANKIGTRGVAILAKHYGIPFYVLGPTSTIDMATATGQDIVIEERPPAEITTLWYEKPMAPAGVRAYNPAFDVTDNALITAIVTEKGIARPPYDESLAKLFT